MNVDDTTDTADPTLRLGELVATFALAQDNAFGQPLESQMRSCLLASWLAADLEADRTVRDTVWWVALLRYVGCTGHAHEVATVFGDEIDTRARTLVYDAANPIEVLRDVVGHAGSGRSGAGRLRTVLSMLAGGRAFARMNFASGCEVADVLVDRLGLGPEVRASLRHTFERWNGKGFPDGSAGEAIPLPMRIVHLSHDMEAIARIDSPADALSAARHRRGRTYDPALVDAFLAHGDAWFARLDKLDPWDEVLELEPVPHHLLRGTELDDALLVMADFIDLKSPFMAGHSRRCAELSAAAAARLGLDPVEVDVVRRGALVHDLGTTAIPNSVWDKPGPLTRAEHDRVELHPMLTEQMLRRTPALASLNAVASAHHERADGSGYHKSLRTTTLPIGARVLAAADVYAALTSDRPHRPALSADMAAAEVRGMVGAGRLEPDAAEAVLAAGGHQPTGHGRRSTKTAHPGGLTDREVDVLRLAARGLTTKQIAERLYISPKTADHHIQHAYTKIGVSTRAAAALWAIEHGLTT